MGGMAWSAEHRQWPWVSRLDHQKMLYKEAIKVEIVEGKMDGIFKNSFGMVIGRTVSRGHKVLHCRKVSKANRGSR